MNKISDHINFLWRKKYKEVIFTIAFVLCLLIIFIEIITNNYYDLKVNEKISDITVIFTAAIIFWYSRETADLKDISNKNIKELRKQVFLQQRPFIRLQWLAQEFYGIRIINEGAGISVNLCIESDNKPMIKRSIVAAERATKSYTDAGFFDAGLSSDEDFKNIFLPAKYYDLVVRYDDIAGNHYLQKFKTNDSLNDKFELVEWDIPEDFDELKLKKVKLK